MTDDFMTLVQARYSCRDYDPDRPVEHEKLIQCLEAARLAPSACNSQPWHFTVVEGREMILKTAKCLQESGMNQFTDNAGALIVINEEPVDLDGLNYLAGKNVDFINKSAMNGTILAHTDGNVPNLMVKIPEQNEFYLGELFYFFEFACGVSGYLLGVNPFNQPGVESYKKNMFALLGKPGYEAEREELLKRL